MLLNEDTQLYKGVFWIVNQDNMEENKSYCFTIPSDCYGNVEACELTLNAKSGTTYNHEKLWKELPRVFTQGKPFNYYPRGRVEIQNGKATVYLNPHINNEDVQQLVIEEFNLTKKNGINKVIFHSDGSEHYRCYLD